MEPLIFNEPAGLPAPIDHDAFVDPRVTAKTARQIEELDRRRLAKTRRQAVWLASYAGHANMMEACRVAKVSRSLVAIWDREDEVFAQLKREAYGDACDAVELALHKRSVEGLEVPVTVAGKREVVRKYSDSLLITRLKALKPEVYDRQPSNQTTNQTNVVVVPIDRLSDAQFKLLESIYGQAGPLIIDQPEAQIEGVGEVDRE